MEKQLHLWTRHQAYLRFIKHVLPFLAAMVVGLFFMIPVATPAGELKPSLFPHMQKEDDLNVATNIILNATDQKNQPFQVSASQGIEEKNGVYHLKSPVFILTLNSGQRVILQGKTAELRLKEGVMDLYTDVNLEHDQGYFLQMDHICIYLKDMTAVSESRISGKGPQGSVQSTGFSLLDHGNKIKLHKQTQLILKTSA